MKKFLSIGAISGALAVITGAFGAHALKNIISFDMMEVYKTGVQYHFYHTFAILAVGILMKNNVTKYLKWSGWLFVLGIILFSGSLYALAISNIKSIGIITPFGGLAFIAGWICLLVHVMKSR